MRSHYRWAGPRLLPLVGLFALSACAEGAIGPRSRVTEDPASTEVARLTAALAANRAQGVRRFDGPRGTAFTLDHSTRVLRSSSGEWTTLDEKTLTALENAFDQFSKADIRIAKFKRDPGFAAKMERASRSPRQVLIRGRPADVASPQAGAHSADGSRGGRGDALSRGGGFSEPSAMTTSEAQSICLMIELSIYTGTQAYNAAKERYEALLAAVVTLGWGFEADGSFTWTINRYFTQLAAWTVAIDLAGAEVIANRIALDYLAIQYELNGCWKQPPDTTPTGGGDGGDETPPTPCQQWVIVEVSNDGGNTWEEVWSGWIDC